MTSPISIGLDPDVHKTLEDEAKTQVIGLATYLRQLAAEAPLKPADRASEPKAPPLRGM